MDYELEFKVLFPGAFAQKNKVEWYEIHCDEQILGVGMTKDDAWKNAYEKWEASYQL